MDWLEAVLAARYDKSELGAVAEGNAMREKCLMI